MYKCTIDEVRHVHSKDLILECTTPYTSANGGDYAHMLELFMVVDFPNGQKIVDDNGNFFYRYFRYCLYKLPILFFCDFVVTVF